MSNPNQEEKNYFWVLLILLPMVSALIANVFWGAENALQVLLCTVVAEVIFISFWRYRQKKLEDSESPWGGAVLLACLAIASFIGIYYAIDKAFATEYVALLPQDRVNITNTAEPPLENSEVVDTETYLNKSLQTTLDTFYEEPESSSPALASMSAHTTTIPTDKIAKAVSSAASAAKDLGEKALKQAHEKYKQSNSSGPTTPKKSTQGAQPPTNSKSKSAPQKSVSAAKPAPKPAPKPAQATPKGSSPGTRPSQPAGKTGASTKSSVPAKSPAKGNAPSTTGKPSSGTYRSTQTGKTATSTSASSHARTPTPTRSASGGPTPQRSGNASGSSNKSTGP